ncbi:MAG TPA: hypothetical protein VIB39_04845 [Candidatus Angelobacter sp.]
MMRSRGAIGLAAFPPPKASFVAKDREQTPVGSVSPAPVAQVLDVIISITRLR